MSFLLVPSKIFCPLSASDKHAVGHISSRKPVVPCGRIVVSSLHCGCSKPGLNPGQDSILLSGSGNMTLLFDTSSYSWILCLKLFGVMCCLPAAKTAGRLQTEVVAQNHGKCPRATYFMPKKWTEWDRCERPRKLAVLWVPRVSIEKPTSTGWDVAACFSLVGKLIFQ